MSSPDAQMPRLSSSLCKESKAAWRRHETHISHGISGIVQGSHEVSPAIEARPRKAPCDFAMSMKEKCLNVALSAARLEQTHSSIGRPIDW